MIRPPIAEDRRGGAEREAVKPPPAFQMECSGRLEVRRALW